MQNPPASKHTTLHSVHRRLMKTYQRPDRGWRPRGAASPVPAAVNAHVGGVTGKPTAPRPASKTAELGLGAGEALILLADLAPPGRLLGDRERTTPLSDMKLCLCACNKTPRDIAGDQSLKAVLK